VGKTTLLFLREPKNGTYKPFSRYAVATRADAAFTLSGSGATRFSDVSLYVRGKPCCLRSSDE